MLELKNSEKVRLFLTAKQRREIERLFTRAHSRISRTLSRLNLARMDENPSLREVATRQLYDALNQEIEWIYSDMLKNLENNMMEMSSAVVDDNKDWFKKLDLPVELDSAFAYVPRDVIQLIVTGQLYDGKWSLSSAVWRNRQKTLKDATKVITEGLAQNLPILDIAKDLERYLDPKDVKEWSWNKVYPGTATKVDYNCQRLARTMIQHAYEQSIVMTTKDNPFVVGIKWITANAHGRTCEICKERARSNEYGLGPGVYPKDKLPLDHPNGLCSFGAEVGNMDDVANRIADWVEGKKDKELDRFIKAIEKGGK